MGKARAASRVACLHANVPNMIGQITAILAHDNANVQRMVNESAGENAYTMFDTDEHLEQSDDRRAPQDPGRLPRARDQVGARSRLTGLPAQNDAAAAQDLACAKARAAAHQERVRDAAACRARTLPHQPQRYNGAHLPDVRTHARPGAPNPRGHP